MTKAEYARRARLSEVLIGLGFSADDAESLRRISNTLRRWYERECNGDVDGEGLHAEMSGLDFGADGSEGNHFFQHPFDMARFRERNRRNRVAWRDLPAPTQKSDPRLPGVLTMRQPYACKSMAGASDASGAVAVYRFDDGRVVLYALAPSTLGTFPNRFRLRALFNRARAKLES